MCSSESVASAKILLLTNYRPEYRHEWGQKTYYTQLRLAPFGKAEAEEFLDALLGISVGTDRGSACRKRAHNRCASTRSQTAHPRQDPRHALLYGRDCPGVDWAGGVGTRSRVGWIATHPTNCDCIFRQPCKASLPPALTASPRRESLAPATGSDWPRVSTESGAEGGDAVGRRIVSPPLLPPAQRVSLRTAGVSRK